MKRKFIKLNSLDISGLSQLGVSHIFVELSPMGKVIREIGFNNINNPIYKYPGKGKFGKYGLMDNATIEITNEMNSDLLESDFDRIFASLK